MTDEDQRLREALVVDDLTTGDAAFTSAVMLRVGRRSTWLRAAERLLAGCAIVGVAALLLPVLGHGVPQVDGQALLIFSVSIVGCGAALMTWRQVT